MVGSVVNGEVFIMWTGGLTDMENSGKISFGFILSGSKEGGHSPN